MILKKVAQHLTLLINSIFFDKYERNFIDLNRTKIFKNNLKKNILIQVVTDYYYLAYYKTLINDPKYSDYNFIGLWPYFQETVRKRILILEILHEFYNRFLNFFIYRKWSKLYKAIGIQNIQKIESSFFFKEKNKFFFKNKSDVINFKINNINIGDILYDTYLRFRAMPTLFLKDRFLYKLVWKCSYIISNLEELMKKYKFVYFFTSYSSYVHHGLPARYFLKKKVIVFSGKNSNAYNKKLSKNKLSHVEDFKKYKIYHDKIKNNKIFLKYSKDDLLKRFSKKSNITNINYLFTDTYNGQQDKYKEINKLKNIDGVLFLQDFYDSPHDWGNLLFIDYYIWTIFTLNTIRKYKLRIAIKPHPNSKYYSPDSVALYKRLKNRYSGLVWLDEDLANRIIFKKIKFGISATGSVLFELAYHKIKAISCGDHPSIDFNFTINAKNKYKYKKILLNINSIKKPSYSKKDLLVFNFLQHYYNFDSYENLARKIDLKKINFNNSHGLEEFDNKYNDYFSKKT
jgi:hypothetical protein